MTHRKRPPWRRQNETIDLHFDGADYTLCVGYFDDGTPAEVFIDGPPKHTGNRLDRESDDMCILISVLLQCGRPAEKIGESLSTEPVFGGEAPASLAKAICDEISGVNDRLTKWATITGVV